MTRVVIAGGGLAGLVTARHLAAAGVDVTVFEQAETVGGRVRSVERDGFVFDRGFQVLLDAYPAARRELDYDDLELRRFPPGAIVGRSDGRSLLADPLREPTKLSDALFSDVLTLSDTFRVLLLRRELAKTPDGELFAGERATIRDGLADRGFSERFIENFAAPFYGGITLDRSLQTDWDVFRYTFKMLATGHAAVPATGMAAIPEQLASTARSAGATIETGQSVAAIEATAGEVSVDLGSETVTADGAVVATDPKTAGELTGVESIPADSVGCTTQFYALPADQDLDVEGRLLLNATDAAPNVVVPHSAVAPEYAPAGEALVSATFLHGDAARATGGPAELSPSELAAKTHAALSRWFPERTFDALEPVHVERVPFAQFAQPPGFRESLPEPDAPDGPIVLAGEYTQWSSIQGALESGRLAAGAIESELPGYRSGRPESTRG